MLDKLCHMGFTPSKRDSDMWIRDRGDHYKLIFTYLDDLLVWSRNEAEIINEIKEDFQLKDVGPPDYYLGGNVDYLTEHWTKENIGISFLTNPTLRTLSPSLKTVSTCISSPLRPQ